MSVENSTETIGSARRWSMLALSMLTTAAAALLINGAAFLLPSLVDDRGLTLSTAGIVVAMPTVGVLLTLFLWGSLVDRYGERGVLVAGSLLTAAAAAGAASTDSTVGLSICLLLGGMAAASANSATGRVVVGWFPAHRRGLAMGIRQMSLPLGVALSSLTIPTLARDHGIGTAMLLPAGACLLAAAGCAVGIVDPPRPSRSDALDGGMYDNPYRGSDSLWRIHLASVLLVVPQYVVWTFALVWLMTDRNFTEESAGLLITATQILGALGRIGAGALSDRVGSRMRPFRWIAIATSITMALLALTDELDSGVSIALLVVASVVTVAPNGLAFTAVAEIAGPFWSGRALGTQNTSQYLAASLVPPLFGAAITAFAFPVAFAISAIFPALAVPVIPKDRE